MPHVLGAANAFGPGCTRPQAAPAPAKSRGCCAWAVCVLTGVVDAARPSMHRPAVLSPRPVHSGGLAPASKRPCCVRTPLCTHMRPHAGICGWFTRAHACVSDVSGRTGTRRRLVRFRGAATPLPHACRLGPSPGLPINLKRLGYTIESRRVVHLQGLGTSGATAPLCSGRRPVLRGQARTGRGRVSVSQLKAAEVRARAAAGSARALRLGGVRGGRPLAQRRRPRPRANHKRGCPSAERGRGSGDEGGWNPICVYLGLSNGQP